MARNHSDAVLANQPLGDAHRIGRDVDPQEAVERAVGGRHGAERLQRPELGHHDVPNLGERLQVLAAVRGAGLHCGDRRDLRDHRRADQYRILHLRDRLVQTLGIHHVADAPAGKAVGLREREQRDRVFLRAGERAGRCVRRRSVGEVLVHLVADVKQAALAAQLVDFAKRGFREDGAGRIVRRDGDDRPRPGTDGAADGVEIQLIPIVGRHEHGGAVGHLNRHLVVEIAGHREDDLVARIGDGEDRVHERHVPAGGDHHAEAVAPIDAVVAQQLPVDRVDERRVAGAVLVAMRLRVR